VLVDYRDTSGKPFASTIVLKRIGAGSDGDYAFDHVWIHQGTSLTNH
jgi:hypothetical protein